MIPVFEPDLGGDEAALVSEALRRGEISGSFGDFIPQFEREFADYCGCKHGIAVTSGTTALHLAVAAAGIGAGDEVLVSASTNIATALAVHHNNAVPVPVDSEAVTWNLDLNLIERLITPKTKAIIPVHLFGHPVDMDALREIADRHRLVVIEDAAEAHGAEVRGKRVGSFSHLACFSFYANKIITTGEGGMITTDDDALAERCRLLRNLAFTVPRFRHEVAGYNFRMTGLQAALGVAQLRRIDEILGLKKGLGRMYSERLADVDELQIPVEMEWASHVYWMYGVRVKPGRVNRDQLAAELKRRGIETRTFFCPMNLQPCFAGHARCVGTACPVAEAMWEDGLYLPSSNRITTAQIDEVCGAIREIFRSGNA